MPSPFPGMDPYLEQFWGDVHASLVLYIRDQLQPNLPATLRARVEERVFVEAPTGLRRYVAPDVRVVQRGRGKGAAASAAGVAVAEPVVIPLPDEPVTQGYVEIIDVASGKKVITVIEVLSPANKLPGPGQEQYLQKQREVLAGGVNLVEIDLLRRGQRIAALPADQVPPDLRTPYLVVVRRATNPLAAELYALPLRQRLPAIKVPLRKKDADVPLDLQALIAQCYQNGGYDADIDYRAEADPPLEADEAEWADELLRRQGHRPRKARRAAPRRRRD